MPEQQGQPVKHDTNKDVYRGQLFVFVDGKPIAFASSATLSITTEEVDASNKMTGNWNSPLPGKKAFSVSSDQMVSRAEGQMSADTLLQKQIKDETVDFVMGEAIITDQTNLGGKFEIDESKVRYSGQTMITNLEITSAVGSLATSSVSMSGIGALEIKDGANPVEEGQ